MIRLLLVDYGEVISTPPPEDTITDLAALADQPHAIFLDRYRQHREAVYAVTADRSHRFETCALQPIGIPPRSGIPSSAFRR
jgi:hypothetical protein